MKSLEKPIIVVLLLLVLSGYLYFSQLGKMALTDPDETFYAQTAKEMVQKGEWLTPILYGKPQFEKPILFYWLIEASYKIFGINEFAARFPSAFFGFLGLVGIYLLGRALFNNRVGILSAVVLATSIEYIALSIACVTDMVLFVFMLFGILFFFYSQKKNKGYFYIFSSASFALATLTKGPVGLALPVLIIAVYLLITRDVSIFRKWAVLLLSAVVFAVIALPWYIIMYKLYAKDFIDAFFGFHNITRFFVPEHKTGSQFYYNIPVILGGFVPWTAFLPLGLWRIFGALRTTHNAQRTTKNASIFVLLWFFIIFIFFSISSTKLPTYIFPCFVSLALIIGKLWDDFLVETQNAAFSAGMAASYYFLFTAVVLSVTAGYIFMKKDYPDIIQAAIITGIFLLFGVTISLIAFNMKKFVLAFFLTAYTIVVALYPLGKLVLPGIESYETSKPVSKVILSSFKEGDIIGCERDFRMGVAFYTDKIPVLIDSSHPTSQLLLSDKRVLVLIKEKNMFTNNARLLYKFGEKRLLTNKAEGVRQ
jgi:4-amino-4-deoxy-L-arabinose transferase-like glycosyltransferase